MFINSLIVLDYLISNFGSFFKASYRNERVKWWDVLFINQSKFKKIWLIFHIYINNYVFSLYTIGVWNLTIVNYLDINNMFTCILYLNFTLWIIKIL